MWPIGITIRLTPASFSRLPRLRCGRPLRKRAAMTPARRLALFYATAFAGPGASLPFLPPFLGSRGLGAEAIGRTLALAMLARLVVAPSAAALPDRIGERRRVVFVFSGVGVAASGMLL
ncbi:MAG: MFS transporter, partial [Elioraea tepidiphila]